MIINNYFSGLVKFTKTVFVNLGDIGAISRLSTVGVGGTDSGGDGCRDFSTKFKLDRAVLKFKKLAFDAKEENSFLTLMRRLSSTKLNNFDKDRYSLIAKAFELRKNKGVVGDNAWGPEMMHACVSAGPETINIVVDDGSGGKRLLAITVWKLLILTTGGVKKIFIDPHSVELFKACCEAYSISLPADFENGVWKSVEGAIKSNMLVGYEWEITNIDLSEKLDPTLKTGQRLAAIEYGLPLDQVDFYKISDFPHQTNLSLEEVAERYNNSTAFRGFRLMIIPFKKSSGEVVAELFKVDENQKAYHIPTANSGSSIKELCSSNITDIVPV